MTAKLFQPITFRNITLKNRIVVSPMCQYSSADGYANDWHLVHLGSRAVGGAGLIICEASAVTPEGRITPDDLGIWKDDHIPMLQRITSFIHEHGSVAGIQLAHAGRKASTTSPWKGHKTLLPEEGGWQTLAPSPIPFNEGDPAPKEMTKADIMQCVHDFKTAALRSIQAGFKVIEIHAAHGYLINEFLSPLTNHRTDEYGGSFENRNRFLLEVIDAVREIWDESRPLFVRISATDWVEGGFTIDDAVALANVLQTKSVDLIDCSSGGVSPLQQITAGPSYQVPFAEAIKKQTGMATGAVGIITSAQQAEGILEQGQADVVLLAREFLRDPHFPLHAARELQQDIAWPVQYERAKRG
ncbi:NADPH dehydrogenase NamA [Aridibaculum aurantiacum]|uniref:NADPH dehydrogenase NamA n=1 Tax=Aridibaculum aurantiacum TaxID=2810307 RepID=UPI001A976D12|nr:NADPH dehydrogenase NamA [Aridibaculum aurantiacum]